MRRIGTVAGVCVVATVLAGCGGGSGGSGSSGSGGAVVDGGTFTLAMNADPGNLDPQASAASNLYQLSHFAYDALVALDDKGTVVPELAKSWQVSGTEVKLTLDAAITCSDGTPFTAQDAAANITYVADPAHSSPFLGVFIPAGATATASGSTVTMTLPQPAPFVLQGLTGVPMVCASGMKDRSVLAHETRGTGPYQLQQVTAGDHFTFSRRDGYTWGPAGASTATKGMPKTIVVKIVPNETTAANLLLSGGLNAASVVGPDAQRLQKSGLFAATLDTLLGEMWFNHADGRPASDPAVRLALTEALDLGQLRTVLTSGQGSAPTELAASPPVVCPGNSVKGALPAHDLSKAKQRLDSAGWKAGADGTRSKNGTPLAITFTYNTSLGSGGSSAAELAAAAWKQLGVKVTTRPEDETAAVQTLFTTGDWDVSWEQVNVSSPDQLVPFLSGAPTPQGTNFAHISNSDYTAAVQKASAIVGTKGCSTWLDAESKLIRAADVVPFANQVARTFGKNARFSSLDVPVTPTTIRMTNG